MATCFWNFYLSAQWPQMSQRTVQAQWITKYLQETDMTQLD